MKQEGTAVRKAEGPASDQPQAKMIKTDKDARKDGITSASILEEKFKFDEITAPIIDAGTNGGDCGYRAFAVTLAQIDGKSTEESCNTERLNKKVKTLIHKVVRVPQRGQEWMEDWAPDKEDSTTTEA